MSEVRAAHLVLASGSRYRRELLTRLALPFSVAVPDVDETARPGEAPETLVARLARAKAEAVAHRQPDALVIGSDQVAVYHGEIVGKPGTPERAAEQLRRISGQTAVLWTGLAVLNAVTGRFQEAIVPFRVVFRTLSATRIASYLARENALDCAGAVRSEGLGIALLERFEGTDPTALIGLPLITLSRMLENEGWFAVEP